MKASLYILQNTKNHYYIGITQLEPEQRLIRHNRGDVQSTRKDKPWKLIYSEGFDTLQNARVREKQIKSWHSGNAFRKLLAKAAGSSNGRTWAFEAQYHSSNLCPAALARKENLPRQ